MLHVNYQEWEKTPQDLRNNLGLNVDPPRTRERFLALYGLYGSPFMI